MSKSKSRDMDGILKFLMIIRRNKEKCHLYFKEPKPKREKKRGML